MLLFWPVLYKIYRLFYTFLCIYYENIFFGFLDGYTIELTILKIEISLYILSFLNFLMSLSFVLYHKI